MDPDVPVPELTKEQFEGHLEAEGLAVDRYLTDDGVWVRAVPR